MIRTITTLAIALMAFGSQAQQWSKANTRNLFPSNWNNYGIQAEEGDFIFTTTGDRVLYSDNYGANWKELLFISNAFSGNPKLIMKNSSRLITLGDAQNFSGGPSTWGRFRTGTQAQLLDTTSGWNIMTAGDFTGYNRGTFYAARFLDDSLGLAYGTFEGPSGSVQDILQTTDGGQTFSRLALAQQAQAPFHIADNDTFYWQQGNTRMLWLGTGGNATQIIPAAATGGMTVKVFDAQRFVALRRIAGGDTLWISEDAGQSFIKRPMDAIVPNGHYLRTIAFRDTELGLIVTDSAHTISGTPYYNPVCHITTDGGASWHSIPFDLDSSFVASYAHIRDTNSLMIYGNKGLYHYGCHLPVNYLNVWQNEGNSYDFANTSITNTGVYYDSALTSALCDSVSILNYTSLPGAWYKFDNSNADERDRALTMFLSAGYGDDRFGNSQAAMVSFGDNQNPGGNDGGRIEDPVLNISEDFSISTYTKVDFSDPTIVVRQILNATNMDNNQDKLNLYLEDSTLVFWYRGNTLRATSTVSNDTWHHLVVQKEDTTFFMYIDKNEVGRMEVNRSFLNPSDVSYEWVVGASMFDMGGGNLVYIANLQGSIDDLMFIPKALNANERDQLFNGQDYLTGLAVLGGGDKSRLYPNPASESSLLVLPKSNSDYRVQIRDLQGRLVLDRMLEGHSMQLDLSHFESGIYFIEANSSDSQFMHKLIVE